MRRRGRIVPEGRLVPLLFVLVWNTLCYSGSRLITTGLHHYNMETALDRAIPFLPWTVVLYASFFVFWLVNYVLAVRQSEEEAWRLLSADFLARVVCLVFFLFLPTTNVRPELTGGGVWVTLMRALYWIDAPDNLFPSIHCLVSWLCFLSVRRNPRVPLAYRVFSLFLALAICCSTLTTRQHVLADVISGIALAEVCYHVAGRSGFSRVYQRAFARLLGRKKNS